MQVNNPECHDHDRGCRRQPEVDMIQRPARRPLAIRGFLGGWTTRGDGVSVLGGNRIWWLLGIQFAGALALLITIYRRYGNEASARLSNLQETAVWFAHDRLLEIVIIATILASGALVLAGYRRLSAWHRRSNTLLRAISGSLDQVIEEKFDTWSLTPAERDIARLAIKGCGTAEIAQFRATSQVTIRVQFSTIYRKAGVNGRVRFVGHLIEDLAGLIPDPDGGYRHAVAVPETSPPTARPKDRRSAA